MNADESPYRKLKDRDLAAEGLFVGEGRLVVERMIAAGCNLHSVLVTPRFANHFAGLLAARGPGAGRLSRGSDLLIVRDESALVNTVGFRFHRGVMACAYRPELPPASKLVEGFTGTPSRGLIVVCSNVEGCENMGAIIRSAAAFGARGVLFGSDCCDPLSRRSLKVSAGTALTVPLARIEDGRTTADAFAEASFEIVGTADVPSAIDLRAHVPAAGTALVLGNEARGLSGYWAERCDVDVRIPLAPGVDSLNVAVAAGILMYALASRRD